MPSYLTFATVQAKTKLPSHFFPNSHGCQYTCVEVPHSSISKWKLHFFAGTSFFKEYLNHQVNKMVTFHYSPSWSFKTNLINKSFHISLDSLELYLFPNCLLNFHSNLYIPPQMRKMLKFIVFRLLENVFAKQKIESRQFHSCHSGQNSPPCFLLSLPKQSKITYSYPGNILLKIYSPQQKGGLWLVLDILKAFDKVWYTDLLHSIWS